MAKERRSHQQGARGHQELDSYRAVLLESMEEEQPCNSWTWASGLQASGHLAVHRAAACGPGQGARVAGALLTRPTSPSANKWREPTVPSLRPLLFAERPTCPSRPLCLCEEPGSSWAAGGEPKACSR